MKVRDTHSTTQPEPERMPHPTHPAPGTGEQSLADTPIESPLPGRGSRGDSGTDPARALDRDAARASSLAALEWPLLLAALGDRLATPYGHQALAAMKPLAKLGAVRHALTRVEQMKHGLAKGMRLNFGEVRPLDTLLDRASREGSLDVAELDDVRITQRAALRLAAELNTPGEEAARELTEMAGDLHPLRELSDTLAGALTPAGALNESAYPQLARLRAEFTARRDSIHRRLEGLLRADHLSAALQDRIYTLRGRRYVLPIKADFRGQLKGIVHDVSASGATLFIEPQQVVEDTNALAMAEKQLELESERILRELSAQVGQSAPELRANMTWLGRVDLIHAQARIGLDYGGTAPKVEMEGVLDLKGLGHPLMLLAQGAPQDRGPDALLDPSPGPPSGEPGTVVRNSVKLGGEMRCLVISGANTGGKTVLLKSLGLAALLVRHGMHVPARAGSRCDLFTEVWADIGDRQSLESSLSTFSAQIRFMASWLGDIAPGALVLLDEMLTGTEPGQGAALATAVLERLLERGATTLVTTHFGELKALAADHPGMVNGAMAFDVERLLPTYRLEVGLPGASYAPDIARHYGLDQALVSAAERTLASRPEALDALLVATHQARRKLEHREEELNRRADNLKRREEGHEREREALRRRDANLRRKEQGEIGRDLRAARKRIAVVIRDLQQANNLPRAGKVSEALAELEQDFARSGKHPDGKARAASTAPGAIPTLSLPEGWTPGLPVWLPHLERGGEIEAVLDDGERLRVRMGALTLEVDASDVRPVESSAPVSGKEQAGAVRPAGERTTPVIPPAASDAPKDIPFALSTEENTLDVRGLSLDEALERCDGFLDLCTYKHVTPVMIIHGHGTGRLKLGLRDHLEHSPYVATFRPGREHEGRDGVTIIALEV